MSQSPPPPEVSDRHNGGIKFLLSYIHYMITIANHIYKN